MYLQGPFNYVTPNQLTAVNSNIGYAYDKNGNMLSDGSRNFEYDYNNRLIKVTNKSTGAEIASCEYDAKEFLLMFVLVVFIAPIAIALSLTLFYGVKRIKKSGNFKRTIAETTLINLVTFIIGSISLLLAERDGFGQLIGLGIYLGCFLIIGILYTIVLLFYRKNLRNK